MNNNQMNFDPITGQPINQNTNNIDNNVVHNTLEQNNINNVQQVPITETTQTIQNTQSVANITTQEVSTDLVNNNVLPQQQMQNIPTVDQTYSSISTNAQSGVAVASAVATAKAEAIDEIKCLVLTSSSFSFLPQTITNTAITSDMVVINSVLSNPSAQTGDWAVTTSNGSLSISGSISGSTTITLYLMRGA